MVVHCHYCQATVDGREIGEVLVPGMELESWDEKMRDLERDPWTTRVVLLKCPACRGAIVAAQMLMETDENDIPIWSRPERVWPGMGKYLGSSIPLTIRPSLEEAQKCLAAGAFTASVVMSGRSIEAMCSHFETNSVSLFAGLKELHDKQIIDARLYAWGDELRKHRNLAAHDGEAKFSAADARDLYDFAIAICEYVFVLTERFERFIKRQAKSDPTPRNRQS